MFRERKTLEAASYILERIPEGPATEYLKVVKLLYLADRELMKQRGRTISGDRMNALRNGPILSETLDLLEGETDRWAEYVCNPARYKVALLKPVAPAALSRADMKALDATLAEHGAKTWQELIEYTHTLPEWIAKALGGARTWATIQPSELAEALGYRKDQARAIDAFERDRGEDAQLMHALGIKHAHV
jgi:uncharacterized phage-associated protein